MLLPALLRAPLLPFRTKPPKKSRSLFPLPSLFRHTERLFQHPERVFHAMKRLFHGSESAFFRLPNVCITPHVFSCVGKC